MTFTEEKYLHPLDNVYTEDKQTVSAKIREEAT